MTNLDQSDLVNKGRVAKALAVYQLLVEGYGEREWHPRDPLDVLISAILSQNTSDVDRDQA